MIQENEYKKAITFGQKLQKQINTTNKKSENLMFSELERKENEMIFNHIAKIMLQRAFPIVLTKDFKEFFETNRHKYIITFI